MEGETSTIRYERGKEVLEKYLRDPRHKDLFSCSNDQQLLWFQEFYERKQRDDPGFQARCLQRHLYLKNEEQFIKCDKNIATAKELLALEPQLQAQINSAERNLEGMKAAMKSMARFLQDTEKAVPEAKRTRTEESLSKLKRTVPEKQSELEALKRSSPGWVALMHARQELAALTSSTGMDDVKKAIALSNRQVGSSTSRAGFNFEAECQAIVTEIASADFPQECLEQTMWVLSNVTLGVARGELDKVVVVEAWHPDAKFNHTEQTYVEVLFVAEVKTNPNDLAKQFGLKQELMLWLAGDTDAYNPEDWKTNKYTKGHFDVEAKHDEHGRKFIFDTRSFARFQAGSYREKGALMAGSRICLQGLYYVLGGKQKQLIGMSSSTLGLLGVRLAGNHQLGDLYINGAQGVNKDMLPILLEWIRDGEGSSLTTSQVLHKYLEGEGTASQIVFVSKAAAPQLRVSDANIHFEADP